MMADVQTQPKIVFLIIGRPAWIRTRPGVEELKDHKGWKNQQGLEKSFVYPVPAVAASFDRISFSLISRDCVRQVQQALLRGT
jgi:hypothetical protein